MPFERGHDPPGEPERTHEPGGCFRHQVLLRRNRHVHDGSSGHPARVSERQHVAQRRNKAPQRHEDVPQGQPPRGESCLHRGSPRLASGPGLVRGWRFCDPWDIFAPEWRPEEWRGVPILRYAFPNMALDGSAREPPGCYGASHVDSDGVVHSPPPWQGPPPNDDDLPDLLLVDDLVGNPAFADAAARCAFVRDLHGLRLRPEYRTVIYATRDGEDALAVADRIAVLQDGRIIQSGTTAEVHHTPVSEHVAQLFSRPPAHRSSRT